MEGCIFCDIIHGRAPSHRLFEDRHVIAFLSLEGHPLVVPKLHFRNLLDLDDAHAAAIMTAAVRVARATKRATGCDGINLVQATGTAAGQDVFHFHLHVKPRFDGDAVVLRWDTTPVADDIRRQRCAAIARFLNDQS